eukprot:6920919-Prorocentrum_lima.AAC.1
MSLQGQALWYRKVLGSEYAEGRGCPLWSAPLDLIILGMVPAGCGCHPCSHGSVLRRGCQGLE